jgi:hypothetical protein
MERAYTMSWNEFPLSGAKYLGAIPVSAVKFDQTKRAELDATPVLQLLINTSEMR